MLASTQLQSPADVDFKKDAKEPCSNRPFFDRQIYLPFSGNGRHFLPQFPVHARRPSGENFLASWPDKEKKKRRRRTGALQALNCLDDLDPAGLIDELAIQLWPRGARFAVLHVVPNGLILASIRHSCVFFRWSPLRFWATRSRVNCTLPYPSIGGWWTVPVFLFFSFQKDLFTFPVQVGSVPACFLFFSLFLFFSPGLLCFGPILFSRFFGYRSWTSVALLVGHNIAVEPESKKKKKKWQKKRKRRKRKTKDSVLSCPKTDWETVGCCITVNCFSLDALYRPCISLLLLSVNSCPVTEWIWAEGGD